MDNFEDEELEEIYDEGAEEIEDIPFMQITKNISTPNNEVSTTFRGDQVVSYSIEPSGVVNAQIDTTSGIINFEKYDENWYGEITLSLQTESGDDEQYDSEYIVNFETEGNETEYVEESQSAIDDIELLSEDEEEDTLGGRDPEPYTIRVSRTKKYYDIMFADVDCVTKCSATRKTTMSGTGVKIVRKGGTYYCRVSRSSVSKKGNVFVYIKFYSKAGKKYYYENHKVIFN